MTRVALVPGVLALLPEYAGLDDPVAELRAACRTAVAWLGPAPRVVGSAQGARVAAALGAEGSGGAGVLLVANGSATRTEKAPGHLDPRAEAFDATLGAALRAGDTAFLRSLDLGLAAELWADVDALRDAPDLATATVDYDDAPFGVQYWVVRWG